MTTQFTCSYWEKRHRFPCTWLSKCIMAASTTISTVFLKTFNFLNISVMMETEEYFSQGELKQLIKHQINSLLGDFNLILLHLQINSQWHKTSFVVSEVKNTFQSILLKINKQKNHQPKNKKKYHHHTVI